MMPMYFYLRVPHYHDLMHFLVTHVHDLMHFPVIHVLVNLLA